MLTWWWILDIVMINDINKSHNRIWNTAWSLELCQSVSFLHKCLQNDMMILITFFTCVHTAYHNTWRKGCRNKSKWENEDIKRQSQLAIRCNIDRLIHHAWGIGSSHIKITSKTIFLFLSIKLHIKNKSRGTPNLSFHVEGESWGETEYQICTFIYSFLFSKNIKNKKEIVELELKLKLVEGN